MADAKWLEVSLTVDGELAEAVAEVLDRFASGGVVVESNVKYKTVEDEGTPYGPVKVFGFLDRRLCAGRETPQTGRSTVVFECHPTPTPTGLPRDRRPKLDDRLERALQTD